jgi:protein TonB
MNLERTGVSTSAVGSLRSCLAEGDPEQERHASRGKRRALVVSIIVQILVLAALVVFPLFSKGERITFEHTPLPPYPRLGPNNPHAHPQICPRRPSGGHILLNLVRPDHLVQSQPIPTRQFEGTEPIVDIPGRPDGTSDGVAFAGPSRDPKPPESDGSRKPKKPQLVTIGHIEPALLTNRVEPIYPRLAITLHHETRVELRAIISTDGSVQSLEVLSGDPLFYNSALDAVHQWRYRPTYLDGQPVEVDTHITVIYLLNH